MKVFDINNAKTMFAECPSNICGFTYRSVDTPVVSSAFLGGSAGRTYRAYGQIYGADASQYTVRMAGSRCDADADLNMQQWNSTTITTSTGHGWLACTLGGDIEAGRVNMTFKVAESTTKGFGQARYTRKVMQVSNVRAWRRFPLPTHTHTHTY